MSKFTIIRTGIILITFSFQLLTLNAQNWTQIGQDIDGEFVGDNTGWSVSLNNDGSIVAIGAPNNNNTIPNTSHVKVYQNISGTWEQIGNIIDGEAERDRSGYSVSLNAAGTILAVGAPYNDGNGPGSGHVRVYQNNAGVWEQIGSDIDGETEGDNSGFSVSLSDDGSVLAIGAPENEGNGLQAGHVRVFKNNGDVWEQIGEDIDSETGGDYSGRSVSLNADGSVLAIGAPYNDGNGSSSGHVRVYRNNTGTWEQIGDDINGESSSNWSGYSVCLNADGSVVAIGAPFWGSWTGQVKIYENIADSWEQIGDNINGEFNSDFSACSVNLNANGSIVAIGAPWNYETGLDAGHVRVFQNNAGIWEQIGEDIDGEAAWDNSGQSVSLSADGLKVAIGAPSFDVNNPDVSDIKVYSYGVLETKDLVNSNISIYPNPSNGQFTVKNAKKYQFTITDICGKTIYKTQIITNSSLINLNSIEYGIYLLSFISDTENYSSKLIIH